MLVEIKIITFSEMVTHVSSLKASAILPRGFSFMAVLKAALLLLLRSPPAPCCCQHDHVHIAAVLAVA